MFTDKKAVIFDMDGTLIDSVWLWHKIDVDFLETCNIAMPADLREIVEGMNFDVCASYFKERFNLPHTCDEIKAQWNSMAEDYYRNKIGLKPYSKELIQKLKSNNYKLAIATSNLRHLADLVLTRNGIIEYFDEIVTSNEVNAEKPKPDVFLKAAQLLNVTPQNCIAFEDTYVGVQSAVNANMYVVAVNDEYTSHKEKIVKLADTYIDSYEEILELV